jgi:hypothetical protein
MRKNAAERKDSDPRLNIPELKTAAQVGLSDLTSKFAQSLSQWEAKADT